MFLRKLVAVIGFSTLTLTGALGCSASSDDGSADTEDALATTPTERDIIALGAAADTRLYVNITTGKAGAEMQKALVDAAKRGLDVRALITVKSDASFDTAWMLQQHLEASGVDTDVRKSDAVPGLYAVADDTALVPKGTTTSKVTIAAKVKAFASSFSALLDEAPVQAGHVAAANTVAVLPMPESGNKRILEVIGAARQAIDLEIYQLQDRAVVGALEAAAGRHVKVRVMLEPRTVGSVNYVPVSAQLKAAGVDVKETPPAFDSSHNVDHAKFMLVDDKELLFGSGNLVRSGLGGVTEGRYANRDFWVEDTRAASLADARELFDADWARTATHGLDALVLTPDNADARIKALVDSAHTTLYVYNQSLDDAELVDAIIAAKRRGADVKVLLGYQPGFGGAPPKNQEAIDKLSHAGIQAAFLRAHYLHAKGIVADGKAYIGSQNFTNGGLRNNRELGEIFDLAPTVHALETVFLSDAANPG